MNQILITEKDMQIQKDKDTKLDVIGSLEEQGCMKLKKLVENGIVSPDDTINLFPLCKIAEKHLKLKESIYSEASFNKKNSDKKSYEQSSAEILNDVVCLLNEMYPGVKIKNISMRQKSVNSFLTKIKGLEIERISKIFAIESEQVNSDKLFQMKEMLKILLKERINENIIGFEGEENGVQERNVFIKQLNKLIDGESIDFQNTAEMFLDEPRFSRSTKSAIARVIYSKINTNKNILLTDLNGITVEKKISPDERKKIKQEFKRQYESQLDYASIERIEDSIQDGNGIFSDERYSSEMERLMDPNEFLRCRDMYGMHIIVEDFDANIETNNKKIDNILKNRSRLYDKNSEEYKEYTQACVDILGSNFASRLKGEGINTEYLKDNPEFNKLWKEISSRTRIIQVKYKDKTNGYKATHFKLQIDNNPDYILEVQVKSDYVYEKSKGNGSAAHQKRIGKKRIIPEILEDENINLNSLDYEQIHKLKDEFGYYLPQYYNIEFDTTKKQYKVIRCNTEENCKKFYEDLRDFGELKETEDYKKIIFAAHKYTDGVKCNVPIESRQNNHIDIEH